MNHESEGVLDLRLDKFESRFAQIAISNSQWFAGIAIEVNAINHDVQLHPSTMNQVQNALEGRHPRYGIKDSEFRLTFDLIDPSEENDVRDFASQLGRTFGKLIEYRIMSDEDIVEGTYNAVDHTNVINLFRDIKDD
jgi:hypothetical protein